MWFFTQVNVQWWRTATVKCIYKITLRPYMKQQEWWLFALSYFTLFRRAFDSNFLMFCGDIRLFSGKTLMRAVGKRQSDQNVHKSVKPCVAFRSRIENMREWRLKSAKNPRKLCKWEDQTSRLRPKVWVPLRGKNVVREERLLCGLYHESALRHSYSTHHVLGRGKYLGSLAERRHGSTRIPGHACLPCVI